MDHRPWIKIPGGGFILWEGIFIAVDLAPVLFGRFVYRQWVLAHVDIRMDRIYRIIRIYFY
jgi:hypothetical protein